MLPNVHAGAERCGTQRVFSFSLNELLNRTDQALCHHDEKIAAMGVTFGNWNAFGLRDDSDGTQSQKLWITTTSSFWRNAAMPKSDSARTLLLDQHIRRTSQENTCNTMTGRKRYHTKYSAYSRSKCRTMTSSGYSFETTRTRPKSNSSFMLDAHWIAPVASVEQRRRKRVLRGSLTSLSVFFFLKKKKTD